MIHDFLQVRHLQDAIKQGAEIEAYDPLVNNWPEVKDVKLLNELPLLIIMMLFYLLLLTNTLIKLSYNLDKNKKTLIFDTNNVLSKNQRKIASNGVYNFLGEVSE